MSSQAHEKEKQDANGDLHRLAKLCTFARTLLLKKFRVENQNKKTIVPLSDPFTVQRTGRYGAILESTERGFC